MVSEEVLFCTELIGLKVYDTRGRRIGSVKDAALVPIIDPTRVDRSHTYLERLANLKRIRRGLDNWPRCQLT